MDFEKITWERFFGMDDSTPIKEIIKTLEALNNVYKQLGSEIEKENKMISNSFDVVSEEAKKLQKLAKSLDLVNDSSQKALAKINSEAQNLVETVNQLSEAEKSNNKVKDNLERRSKKLSSSIDELTKSTNLQSGSVDDLRRQLKEAEKQYASFGDEVSNSIKDDTLKKVTDLTLKIEKQSSSLKEAKKQGKELAKSSDDLIKAQEEFDKVFEEATSDIDDQTGSLIDLKNQLKEAEAEYRSFGESIDEAVKQDTLKKITELGRIVTEGDKAIRMAKRGGDELAGSYNALVADTNRLSQQLKNLPDGLDLTSAAAQRLQKQIAANNIRLKQFDKAIGDNFRNVGNYESALEGLRGATKDLGNSLLGGGNTKGAVDGLLASAGAFNPLIAGGIAAVGAFSRLSTSLRGINKQLDSTRKLFGGNEKESKELTAALRATADVFDKDYNEVLRSANTLAENFGINGLESVDIINEALLRGADINDDFLDQISEYSVQFKEAGLSARTLVNTVLLGEDRGVFSDKAADAVKEATIRIRELTPATKSAIQGLGLNADKIEQQLADGSIKIVDVIAQVSEELNKLPDTSQVVGTAIADIFGGPGEDAGIAFLRSLKDINKETEDFTKNLSQTQKVTKAYLDSQELLNKELLESGDSFEDANKSFLALVNNFLASVTNGGIIGSLIDSFTSLNLKIAEFIRIANTDPLEENFSSQLKKEIEDFSRLTVPEQEQAINSVVQNIQIWRKELTDLENFYNSSNEAFRTQNFEGLTKAAKDYGFSLDEGIEILKDYDFELEVTQGNVKLFEDLYKNFTKILQENTSEQKKATKEQSKLNVEQAKAQKSLENKILNAQAQLEQARLARQVAALDQIFKNEKQSNRLRIKALDEASQKRIDIERLEKDIRLRNIAENVKNEQLAAIERTKVLEEFSAQAEQISNNLDREVVILFKVDIEDGFKDIDETLKKRLLRNEIDANEALLQNETNLQQGLITTQEFRNKTLDIENEFRDKSLNDELNFIQNKLKIIQFEEDERLDAEKRISELRLELERGANESILRDREKLNEKLKELQASLIQFGDTLITNSIEKEIARNEEELVRLDESTQARLQVVQDDAQAQAFIEQDAARKKIEIEKNIAKEKRKIAIFEKAKAIGEIAIDTARGVSSAVAQSPLTFGLPFSAFVLATGIAQTANVLSTPIPSFYVGTDYAPGGYANVAERGGELQVTPQGQLVYRAKPQVSYIEKGSKIIPAPETQRIIKEFEAADYGLKFKQNSNELDEINNSKSVQYIYDERGTIIAIKSMEKNIVKAINNSPVDIYDERGFRRYNNGVNENSERLNKRYSFK